MVRGCEEPACVHDCSANIDIPAVLLGWRRTTFWVQRVSCTGRAPFGALCGTVCPAEQLCQQHCYRRSFAGQPVRIAELMNWVEEAGWLRPEAQHGSRIAVLGGNLAEMTCAYYLTLAGFGVDVLDEPASLPEALGSLESSLNSISRVGVHYLGGWDPAQIQPGSLLQTYTAVNCASDQWAENLDASSRQAGVFRAPASTAGLTPAQLVAEGRRAAFDIYPHVLRVLG
jgi:hypothetical protein